jgi:hypothetical protein
VEAIAKAPPLKQRILELQEDMAVRVRTTSISLRGRSASMDARSSRSGSADSTGGEADEIRAAIAAGDKELAKGKKGSGNGNGSGSGNGNGNGTGTGDPAAAVDDDGPPAARRPDQKAHEALEKARRHKSNPISLLEAAKNIPEVFMTASATASATPGWLDPLPSSNPPSLTPQSSADSGSGGSSSTVVVSGGAPPRRPLAAPPSPGSASSPGSGAKFGTRQPMGDGEEAAPAGCAVSAGSFRGAGGTTAAHRLVEELEKLQQKRWSKEALQENEAQRGRWCVVQKTEDSNQLTSTLVVRQGRLAEFNCFDMYVFVGHVVCTHTHARTQTCACTLAYTHTRAFTRSLNPPPHCPRSCCPSALPGTWLS